jgi:hypothetical protein
MTRTKSALLATAAALAGLTFATMASAASLVALVDGKSLVMINPTDWKAAAPIAISGATDVLGIDVRPADGMLYGLTKAGDIVTIDPASGKATMKSKLSETLKDTSALTFDFNPAADRLRIMSTDGTNLRVNVDDGKATVDGSLKYAETDMHKGEKPNIVAGAYTNSMNGKKPEATALYDIDATISGLIKQAPPNDGVLNAVGKLGVTVSAPVAFNIVAADGKNTGWLVSGGTLHQVNLETGKATVTGKLGVSGMINDIAWWE